MIKGFTNSLFSAFICCLAISIFTASTINAQPPNDDCLDAIPLTQEANCTSTAGDVTLASESQPGCEGTAGDDVWYSFTALSPTPTIEVTGSTDFDPVVEVFDGTCGTLTSLVCRDNDFTGGGTEIITSSDVDYPAFTVGGTYFIRTYDWFAPAPASTGFDICVHGPCLCQPPG